MKRRKTIIKITKIAVRSVEIISLPLVYPAALLLKTIRKIGLWRFPILRKTFYVAGILPVNDHYYGPMVNPTRLKKSLGEDRNLPGLDLNISEQLHLLSKFQFSNELGASKTEKEHELQYHFDNIYFTGGDAEYYYNIIRLFHPKSIIEIGSGFSTLLALEATRRNLEERLPECNILSIEPYENYWLEKTSVSLLRKKIEETDLALFDSLKAGDILFIDSSHMIRPQGDVLHEYFEILPRLASGVLVHIHDIFTPKDYPEDWVVNDARIWNEQYLVEAFLMMNSQFRIIGALNYLWHHHYEEFTAKCTRLNKDTITGKRHKEPSSLWLIKN